ncbi:uncharacterized protein LOC133554382 isoform X2 [Nerophis ophidion]|uniref:uncharacterized protein LOC133554382 isoform X2 n=1 Tax=Nerophis ophidion TaxID=159077 RepID=UPI002AE0626E|nr:uncharacterized protein LOC133554382 isoform X2 [Nerophis ophidion]
MQRMRQEDPQPLHIKEEEEYLWITHEGEGLPGQKEADLTKFPLTLVSVKTMKTNHLSPYTFTTVQTTVNNIFSLSNRSGALR